MILIVFWNGQDAVERASCPFHFPGRMPTPLILIPHLRNAIGLTNY
ncbi:MULTISPECIES: hypothetical protein [Moorena]|nr:MULTISPECIES: hypothetical protein [Moorena]NEO75236.1 hypothetical protein [Moorena sp. SIO4G3]